MLAWVFEHITMVVGIVTGAVTMVEHIMGAAKGTEKKSAAKSLVTQWINSRLGLKPGFLETGIDDLLGFLVDGAVALLNSNGTFTHKAGPGPVSGAVAPQQAGPGEQAAADAKAAADNALTQGAQAIRAVDGNAPASMAVPADPKPAK